MAIRDVTTGTELLVILTKKLSKLVSKAVRLARPKRFDPYWAYLSEALKITTHVHVLSTQLIRYFSWPSRQTPQSFLQLFTILNRTFSPG